MRTPTIGKDGRKADSHPELLDFLAKRFVDSGWSIKAMHKERSCSRAFPDEQQGPAPKVRDGRSTNLLWSRFKSRADVGRANSADGILALSGNLDATSADRCYHGASARGRRQQLESRRAEAAHDVYSGRRGMYSGPAHDFDYGDATTPAMGFTHERSAAALF